MRLEKNSPCKVNLLLNILRKRADGFHELETVMHPVALHDVLSFERSGSDLHLRCSNPDLPVDSKNLVWRAADAFFRRTAIHEGVSIHLQKNIPMAAGLGGGSGNAATTLLGLNELFARPLTDNELHEIAATLGSDINFFLQNKPALATGRGEQVQQLEFFPALRGTHILLVHPGFGISTPWAYQQLIHFPEALNGQPGRAQALISRLQTSDFTAASAEFYNSLEAPALRKYPLLFLFQKFFRDHGAATLMSGSGSTTFALVQGQAAADALLEKFYQEFGDKFWTATLPFA